MKAELDPNMLSAVRAVVQEGMALREAARKYRVPRTTLQRRIHSTQVVAAVTATAPAHPAALPRTPTQQQHDATASDSSSTLNDNPPPPSSGQALGDTEPRKINENSVPALTGRKRSAVEMESNTSFVVDSPAQAILQRAIHVVLRSDPASLAGVHLKGPRKAINGKIRMLCHTAGRALDELSNELITEGRTVYKLSLGQSPFPVPQCIVDELRANAHERDYLPVAGLPALCEDIAAWGTRSLGLPYTRDDVLVGPGTKELLFVLQTVYYGDLLLPNPSCTSYAPQANIAGRNMFWLPTNPGDRWVLRPEVLEEHCAKDPKAPRVLILNSPSNPTGTVYREDELKALAEVARRYRVLVISDEIYSELHHVGEHHSISKFYPEGTIVSGGLSKWCGAGGWRMGFWLFPASMAWLRHSMIVMASETYTSVASPIQHAARRAFVPDCIELAAYKEKCCKILKIIGLWCCHELREMRVTVLDPEGGFYVFPCFGTQRELLADRGILTDIELCQRVLNDTGVALLPGSAFGRDPTELYVRVAFVDFKGDIALYLIESMLVAALYSRQGFFGVEGKYFDEILAVREIVESVLQAYQAYRMSQLLARPWLNRFYVTMLVVNCWMVPIVHFVCRHRVMHRRALGLLFDATLDFTSAMVVPTVLLFSYYPDFDVPSWGFPYTLWFDDMWVVNVVTEFQIMLVASWGDLASRCVFSIGLISCIESTKELLRESSPADAKKNARAKHQVPIADAKEQTLSPAAAARPSIAHARAWSSFRQLRHASLRRMLQSLQVMCAALGAVVVVLHLYAESAGNLDNCMIQVHPWLERKPACVLLQWDCHTRFDSGDAAAITAQWSKTSPAYVRRVLLLHCSQLQMPPLVTAFHEMTGMKVYNSTIAAWNSDAALTATNHPRMVLAYFARVNTSSTGELPPGLMTAPFPPTLWDIEFAVSNLRKLPDDLDTKWPLGLYFTCERCEFTAVPPAIVRLMPYWITFAENPFTGFPFEVFQIPVLEHFGLAGVPLPSLLPPTQGDSFLQDTSVRYLYLAGTNVTWLPRWVDAFAALPRSLWYQPALDLTFTPMCEAIGQMQAGTLERFPPEWTANVPADQLSRYMTVTRSNISALDGVVGCFAFAILGYPLGDEDGRYML
ncbi:hypothetical protein ATCC90586_005194 [Pythium insidiosum]|nr:hypothetical protein ATCC90586_005194 [Pythium insidiosum]